MKSLTTVVFLIVYSYSFLYYCSSAIYGTLWCDFLVFILHKVVEFLGSVDSSNLEIFYSSFFTYFSILPPDPTSLRLLLHEC